MKSISKKPFPFIIERRRKKYININVVLKVVLVNTWLKGLQGFLFLYVLLSLFLSLLFSCSGKEKDNRRRWWVVGTGQANRVYVLSLAVFVLRSVRRARAKLSQRWRFVVRFSTSCWCACKAAGVIGEGSITPLASMRYSDNADNAPRGWSFPSSTGSVRSVSHKSLLTCNDREREREKESDLISNRNHNLSTRWKWRSSKERIDHRDFNFLVVSEQSA